MKNINCRHCQNPCKMAGKTECNKYQAKADRPSQLPKLINEAIVAGDMQLVKELQKERDAFYYGVS
jgi:pyruvate-formate lyase-activating enzyme